MDNKLLVIDDEPDIGEYIGDVAEGLGFDVVVTDDPEEFRVLCASYAPSVIAMDLMMPQADGIELLRGLAEIRCDAQVLLISGADTRVLATAQRLGATQGLQMLGSLQKPFSVENLQAVLEEALEKGGAITEADVKAAVEAGELVVHYQPKAQLEEGDGWTVAGAEALVRWQHPQLGLLPPGRFLPLAEGTEAMVGLTDFVLRTAIAEAGRWQAEGLPLTVSVNLPPQILTDLDLPDRIAGTLRENDLAPGQLVLEITESAAMADATVTMDILSRFRLKGFGLSIDDFGTGYSSLVQLHRMPFSEMKIDKSFVMEIGQNDEAAKIVQSIADLGHNMGLSLCAEGVETEEALAFLRSIRCGTAQGFLIGKPLPADEFAAFVGTPETVGAAGGTAP